MYFYNFVGEIEEIEIKDITEAETGGDMSTWEISGTANPTINHYHSPDPKIYFNNSYVKWDDVPAGDTARLRQSFSISPDGMQARARDTNASPPITTDGYALRFSVTWYSGSLEGFVTGAEGAANSTSNAYGFEFSGIQGGGYYEVLGNMDGTTAPTIGRWSEGYGSLETIQSGSASIKTVPAGLWGFMNNIIFEAGSDGFDGTVNNISLRDLTNYFTIVNSGVWDFYGFDLNVDDSYIFWDNTNQNIVFSAAPVTIGKGTISLKQSIAEHGFIIGDTVNLKFDVDVLEGTNTGSISGYFINDQGHGIKFGPISTDTNYDVDHVIGGDEATEGGFTTIDPNYNRNVFVIEVESDSFSGTLDNFELYRIFPNFIPSTITYSEDVKGWVSFKSFIPESGLSLSKGYYTMKDGKLWKHHSNETRNTFYDYAQLPSSITAVLNTEPSLVKIFNTLNYEGSQSKIDKYITQTVDGTTNISNIASYNIKAKDGWYVDSILTDKQTGNLNEFIEKEGKWFNYIKGDVNDIQTSDLSFQGLGIVSETSTITNGAEGSIIVSRTSTTPNGAEGAVVSGTVSGASGASGGGTTGGGTTGGGGTGGGTY